MYKLVTLFIIFILISSCGGQKTSIVESPRDMRLHNIWGLMYVDNKADAQKIQAVLELYPAQEKILLTLSCGTIEGKMEQSENNIHFFAIPYGESCLGVPKATKVVGSLLRTKHYKFNHLGELVMLNNKSEIIAVWNHID